MYFWISENAPMFLIDVTFQIEQKMTQKSERIARRRVTWETIRRTPQMTTPSPGRLPTEIFHGQWTPWENISLQEEQKSLPLIPTGTKKGTHLETLIYLVSLKNMQVCSSESHQYIHVTQMFVYSAALTMYDGICFVVSSTRNWGLAEELPEIDNSSTFSRRIRSNVEDDEDIVY